MGCLLPIQQLAPTRIPDREAGCQRLVHRNNRRDRPRSVLFPKKVGDLTKSLKCSVQSA